MLGWSDEQQQFRAAVRRFVEMEVAPRRLELEHGDLPPYGLLREMFAAFGIGAANLERFERSLEPSVVPDRRERRSAAEVLIPIVELSRHSPGMVTAMGVSVGLAAGAILRAGT